MNRSTLSAPLLAAALLMAVLLPRQAAAQTEPIIQDSLSLEGTLRYVFEANPGITQLDELVAQANARVAQNRTGLLPQVTATATYTRLDPVPEFAFPGASEKLSFIPHNNYDAHVTAQYALYDFGGNKARIALAEGQSLVAKDNIAVARRDLAYNAVQTYYSILALRESIRVSREQVASLEAHRAEVEKRVQGGVATRFDVSQTRVRIAQAQSQQIDLQNQLRQQEIQLARLLHRPDGAAVPPVRGRLTYAPLNPDVNALITQALEQRVEIKQARDNQQVAVLQRSSVEHSNKPVLGIGAQVGAKNGYIPEIQKIRPNTTGVVQLSVPIFDGNKNRNQRVEAEAGIRAADARVLDVQEQIRADVRGAVAEIQSQAARYDNAQLQIQLANDALTRALDRQKAEVGTNLDVLDAETSLAQAKLTSLQATYGYLMGQYRLKRATGQPIE